MDAVTYEATDRAITRDGETIATAGRQTRRWDAYQQCDIVLVAWLAIDAATTSSERFHLRSRPRTGADMVQVLTAAAAETMADRKAKAARGARVLQARKRADQRLIAHADEMRRRWGVRTVEALDARIEQLEAAEGEEAADDPRIAQMTDAAAQWRQLAAAAADA